MKITHRKDNTFVIKKNGNPYHVIKGMKEYDELLKSYSDNSSKFNEEVPGVLLVIDCEAQVRAERNHLLEISDWTQISDSPLTSEQRSVWKKYRQELRDLPKQSGFPKVNWPKKPE